MKIARRNGGALYRLFDDRTPWMLPISGRFVAKQQKAHLSSQNICRSKENSSVKLRAAPLSCRIKEESALLHQFTCQTRYSVNEAIRW